MRVSRRPRRGRLRVRHERAPRARGPRRPRRFDDAGPGFARDLDLLGGCRTGEAKCVPAPDNPARRIILTVGPRYADKYRTAAENALSHCYRGALECAVEAKRRGPSPCRWSTRTPRDFRASARRARRGETAPSISRALAREIRRRGVMRGRARRGTLRGNGGATRDASNVFFPRDAAEARVAEETLPEDVGNEHGEARNAERDITIASFPVGLGNVRVTCRTKQGSTSPSQSPSASFLGKVGSANLAARGFDARTRTSPRTIGSGATISPSRRRFARVPRRRHRARRRPGSARSRRERLLSDASDTNLSDVESSGAVRARRRDFVGRRRVTIDAATVGRFDVEGRGRRVLMYAAKALAPVVSDSRRWTLVYFHSGGGGRAGCRGPIDCATPSGRDTKRR